jgi:O-antigen/teichoic acid export membrane protein
MIILSDEKKMNKATLNFWVDTALFILLLLAILMIMPEIKTHSFIHVIPGLLILVGVVVHLYLHRKSIKAVFQNYRKMDRHAQENVLLNLALFGAYLVAGGVGGFARLMLFVYPHVHFHLGILHVVLTAPLLTLQAVHLARHFKWIRKNIRTRILT